MNPELLAVLLSLAATDYSMIYLIFGCSLLGAFVIFIILKIFRK